MIKCEKINDCKTNRKYVFCKYCIHNENKIKICDYHDFDEEKYFKETFKMVEHLGVKEE
ncbi:ipid-A-disaccharide synthase [Clostridium botulinum B str. Osaka05]|uniref:Ipid-A-disaccharide synthase n=1 Tax=Clostridium botulinum B str. Osaka05 TaxID=1407017 RepID=A0A060N2Z9_CLOBO|nr:hypothetical protein [Clostridium botulinum]BAO04746.1 ipid-A-disaccharide synthase [Clostridium botulinum B str. Osaka05]